MIVLARHGETDANRAGLLLGQADPPLNDHGRGQAARLAGALTDADRPAIYTSPLSRARETAAAIATATSAAVTVDERLLELDYGAWDGLRLDQLPRGAAASWRADPTFRPPDGESLVDLHRRVAPFAAALRTSRDGTSIVVSHVSPIKALLLTWLDLDPTYAWRLRLDVASICRIGDGPAGPVLVTFNETGHLR